MHNVPIIILHSNLTKPYILGIAEDFRSFSSTIISLVNNLIPLLQVKWYIQTFLYMYGMRRKYCNRLASSLQPCAFAAGFDQAEPYG